jgi:hypothetical protein
MMGTGYFSLWARPGEATAADLARVLVSGIATAAAIATLVFLIGTIADRRRVREMRAELAVWPDPPSSVNAASARKGTPSSRPKG